ncbi:MAG: HigA family addiction module antidote protein [Chlorobiaceae bacterium]|jgi:antitoxin HigA-1|nr:HigA family addiction module antidote protein [Chlorobiaceae bacterium]
MSARKMEPLHPGTVLLEDFLNPMNISETRVAEDIHIPVWCINEIISGKRCVTANTALRLARYFGTPPQFWLGLQMDYDLKVAQNISGDDIEREILVFEQSSM